MVTGTIIAVIGISLMRVGVGWATGAPANLAQTVDGPKLVGMVDAAKAAGAAASASAAAVGAVAAPALQLGPIATLNNPAYSALDNLAIAAFVLVLILLLVRFGKGFVANIAVRLGIVAGCVLAAGMGKMHFDKVAKAHWCDVVTPFAFGRPIFDGRMVLTMTLVMVVVVVIESTGMFLALSDITAKPLSQTELSAGLRTDGLGTLIGGIFNTFPYTSFSQNVGLAGVTGVRSRFVCVAAGLIMIVLGLLPKMAALVESVPQFVLGGAGLVPLVAPRWAQHMPHSLQVLLQSGILLAALTAVVLNLYFNGSRGMPKRRWRRQRRLAHIELAGGRHRPPASAGPRPQSPVAQARQPLPAASPPR